MARHDACPSCGSGKTGVTDSRVTPVGRWRRRGCEACGARWTTLEVQLSRGTLSLAPTLRRSLRAAQQVVTDLEGLLTHMPDDLPLLDGDRRPPSIPVEAAE